MREATTETPLPLADEWLTVDGGRYRYRLVAGDHDGAQATTPLVLINGLGTSVEYWARLQPLLAARRPVYAVDLPGAGGSSRPDRALNSNELAVALWCWLAALGLPRVHLLGHSLGAQVAAEFAHDHPECVARLILVAPTIGKRGPNAVRRLLDLLRDVPREDLSLLPVVIPAYLRAGLWRILRTDLLVNDDDTVATVARLATPPLIVRGRRDCVVDDSAVRQLLRANPAARLAEIPDAAHAPHWSHPRELAAITEAFLDVAEEAPVVERALVAAR